jgi:hypothetical protein
MPHKRVDITQDDLALQKLSGSRYKILHYLINRADSRGICYPGIDTIASGTGYSEPTVRDGLQALNECNLMRYLRRDEQDPVTKRQLSNVYMINPQFISLPTAFVAESRALWFSLREKCGNHSAVTFFYGNQQPTPVSQYQETTPVNQYQGTNTNNQHSSNPKKIQLPAQQLSPEGKDTRTAAGREGQMDTPGNKQRNAQSDKSQGSVVREKYHNPEPIQSNLPDRTHEALALAIRNIGISMPLARGFIVTYGMKRCETAIESVKTMGSSAKNPAGLFRTIVQNDLADAFALARHQILNMR